MCFCAFGGLLSFPAHAAECAAKPDLLAGITQLVDGDTLVLGSGEHVRFIGINTPELARSPGHTFGPDDDQPLARAALGALDDLLDSQVALVFGQQKHDRYGRLLAHPFDENGRNITRALLAQGMGFMVAISPNQRLTDCYVEAEQSARRAGRGVWGEATYAPVLANELRAGRHAGFTLVQGRVERMHSSRTALWIDVAGNMTLMLQHKHMHNFAHTSDWLGKQIEVRGWIIDRGAQTKPWHKRLMINISHPAMLKVLAGHQ